MRITKFGHCCLLIEENGKRIITDPGVFTTEQNEAENIDIIVITHEHSDHFHLESVKKLLEKSPQATIVTNRDVGALLTKEGITFVQMEDGQEETIKDIRINAVGKDHAVIHASLPPMMNTGYFITERFFCPGDSFVMPGKHVDILALPVAGPWMKISEAIDYAWAVKPKMCIPVHDGILRFPGMLSARNKEMVEQKSIGFVELPIGTAVEL